MQSSVSEPYFVLLISWSPKIEQKWFCIQNLRMDLSFQEKKANPMLGCQDICKINTAPFFLNTLYIIAKNTNTHDT